MKKTFLAIVSVILSVGANAQGIEIYKSTNGGTPVLEESYTNSETTKYSAKLTATPESSTGRTVNGNPSVTLKTTDGTNTKDFVANADGSLTWNGIPVAGFEDVTSQVTHISNGENTLRVYRNILGVLVTAADLIVNLPEKSVTDIVSKGMDNLLPSGYKYGYASTPWIHNTADKGGRVWYKEDKVIIYSDVSGSTSVQFELFLPFVKSN